MYDFLDLPDNFIHKKYTPEQTARFDKIIQSVTTTPISEALTPKQRGIVDKWDYESYGKDPHDDVFGKGNDRIILPYDSSTEEKVTSNNFETVPRMRDRERYGAGYHHKVILSALRSHGYHTDDYSKGTVAHNSTPTREIKIDSALKKIGIGDTLSTVHTKPKWERDENGRAVIKNGSRVLAEGPKQLTYSQAYAADPVRASIKTPKQIVITRNKYDVAGQSTDRSWTSCMDMVNWKDQYSKHLPEDIYHKTLCAYVTNVPKNPKENESEVNNPLGRINIKKFTGSGHTIYRPEETAYGMLPTHAHDIVKKWSEDNYPSKPGIYTKAPSLYNDDGKSIHIEKMEEIPHHEMVRHVSASASRLLDSEGPKNDYDGTHDDEMRDSAYAIVRNMFDKLPQKEHTKAIISAVADASREHPYVKQDTGETRFYTEYRHDLDGDDVIQHHGIVTVTGSNDWKKGIKEFNSKDVMDSLNDIHSAIKGDEGESHEATKEAHSALIDHAFTLHDPALHDHIINHVVDPVNQDYYSDMHNTHNTFYGNHPSRHITNPRLIQRTLESDSVHLDARHATDSLENMHHIGKHADAKLAHFMFHHPNMDDAAVKHLMRGLNDNPHGEEVQNQLVRNMHLPGQYTGKGELKDVHTKRDLDDTRLWHGHHVGTDYTNDANEDMYSTIGRNTKFKSVHDVMKNRPDFTDNINHGVEQNPNFNKIGVKEAYINMAKNPINESKTSKISSIQEAYLRMILK